MATETQIGKLVIDLQIKTQALEKGLETAKKKIQEMEESNKNLKNSNESIDASFIAMSATAVLALNKILGVIKDCINEYNSYTQAMSGLQNIADYTGQDMNKLTNIMQKFMKYGLTQTDIATAIKNFSLMGYTAEETEQMIMSLTESAISNRQACYSVSEAVRMASEGYKNGISTLSDAAGVTENLSVMESKYAESIGKTVGQLTEAEKNQAYLNRTMEAAAPFAGAAAEYMETLAGEQGQFSQAMRETQVAYAESLEPVMSKILEKGTGLLQILNSLISANPKVTAGMTTFTATLITAVIALTALSKAKEAYTKATGLATISVKGFTAALMANPIFLLATTIATVISAISMLTTAINENQEAQERLNETTERYNSLREGTFEYTDSNIAQLQADKEAIEHEIDLREQLIELEKQLQEEGNPTELITGINPVLNILDNLQPLDETKAKLKEVRDELDELEKSGKSYGNNLITLNAKLKATNDSLDKGNAIQNISKSLDINTIKTKQKEAAQLKINANQMQNYFNIVKNGDKTTTEYQNAVTQLSKAYPEASTAGGLLIDVLEGLIGAEQLQADEAWNASQRSIQGHIANIQAALNDENVQRQVANNMGIAYDETFRPKLEAILALLQLIGGYQPTDVPNIQPVTTTTPKRVSSSGSSSYSNKALDNYKKEIEHKKALDQISVQQEISMYEYALKKYAKTADEKNEIREKIYDLNKELAQKEKEILNQQTEDYEAYIQEQKNLRGAAYDITEQTSDYNKIIQMHRNYLNQIMQDERLSLEERKEIYREELQVIRDYEQQKRDLRVEQIDNTVSQLTDAITAQLEEMQEKDKELIDKNLEEVENWKNARIDAINEEYDARIEAIDKELEALNKAEEQKTRDEEDAEYERKKLRLEQLIEFEHDATTKANYQKELDKLIAEYQETLDKRELEDKKEALNEQKELLQQEQEDKVQAIEDEAEKQKEVYEKQLEDLEKYYEEQINMAQETAEKMLLNVEQNQNEILNLLQKYGDAYEITGQSLGEKLAQGINEGIASKIENIIQKIQDTIDAGIENKLAELSSSVYKYETGTNKPQVASKTINVYQTNNIEQNPELPSETYRKLKNIDEQLAAQLAGI